MPSSFTTQNDSLGQGQERPSSEAQPTDPTVIVNAGTEQSKHIMRHSFELGRIILTACTRCLNWRKDSGGWSETTISLKWGWEEAPMYLHELLFSESRKEIMTSFPSSFVGSGPNLL